MVLQSPIYKAPSISKMGKKSSPLNSSSQKIESAVKAPELKSSKMSFVKGLGISIITTESLKTVEKPVISTNTLKIVDKIILKPEKPEKLKGSDTSEVEGLNSIVSTLTETNSILVEIQKQLALDFSNRIAERKNELAEEKSKIRAQKLSKKEQFVEKSKGLGSGITKFASKALAPIKGIFDKILEFLTIVGTGMLINSIWTWLQDKENRDKVIEVFAFLKTYWKEIFFTILTLAVVKKLISLIVFANRLRKLFNLFRGKKPGGGGAPPGGCGPVLSCVTAALGIGALTLTALAAALLGKGLVAPPLEPGLVEPPTTGQPPVVNQPVTAPALPFQDIYDLGNNPILRPLADIGNSREFQIASLLTALGVAGVGVALPEPATTTGGLAAFGPILAKLKLLMSAPKLALAGGALSLTPMMAMAKDKGIEIPENEIAGQIVQYFGKTKDELLKIYKDKNATPVERIAAERTLIEQYKVKLDPPEFSRGGIIPGLPSMQDTVHALLAKGEFVINSMSTKMFKPFLYAINNNAGRLFKQFIEGVNLMKKNNELSEELTKIQFVMVKKLNTQVEELVEREKEKKRKELEAQGGGTGGGNHSRKSQIKTKPKKVPTKIQTYRRGKGPSLGTDHTRSMSNEGQTSVVEFNVTQPAIQLAGQETPEPVPTESSERSQKSITISSTDSSNPYIVSSYVNYGIDV